MDIEKIKGYDDQELLITAYVKFISNQIDRSEQIVKGMMRQSITEWVTNNNSSLREIKHMEEGERLRIVSEIIDIFLNKIKHIVQSNSKRQKLKDNAIQIYEQWKNTKRVNPSDELGSEIEKFMEND